MPLTKRSILLGLQETAVGGPLAIPPRLSHELQEPSNFFWKIALLVPMPKISRRPALYELTERLRMLIKAVTEAGSRQEAAKSSSDVGWTMLRI